MSERTPFHERSTDSLDGDLLRACDPLRKVQSIDLSKITEVGIETNSLGPFVEDVFWSITDGFQVIQIPQCSPIFPELLERFKSLDGFDWDSFGRSMSCTDDAYFLCWSRVASRPNLG
jgi:hypothetical protein